MPVGAPLRKLIEMIYLANVPILLEGPHGLGKSDLRASGRGLGHRRYRARSVGSGPDRPHRIAVYGQRSAPTAPPPACLPEDGQGLLVFEELNRCLPYVCTPCLQLLTARRLHDYVLPTAGLPSHDQPLGRRLPDR